MKKSNKEFLKKFSVSNAVAEFKKLAEQLLKKDNIIFIGSDGKPISYNKSFKKTYRTYLKKTADSKGPAVFKCTHNSYCLLIPMIQGDAIYGYLLFPHLTDKTEQTNYSILMAFIDSALREFQKEQELAKLYDTIRPRAIALSTIHTIHRLLTSTLNMDELIERIARLTLQVMRSNYCAIMLLDETGKYLIPKAVIDIKNNNLKKTHNKIKTGTRIEGNVAKTGKAHLSNNHICVPLIEEDVIGIISAKYKINNMPFDKFELEILLTLAEQAVIAIKNAQLYHEQEKMAFGSIKSLAALLDAKSPNTYTHSELFVKIALAIAEEMRLSREEIADLHYAALLPDTGKFSIPEEILKKRGSLSKKEFDIIKKQHLESLKIIEHLECLKPAARIIRYHHERYDGTGYPEGLKGNKIPIGSRIMAVSDAFEAMLFKKDLKISFGQAVKEIERNKYIQFDPDVVNAFQTVIRKPEFEEIFRNLKL